MNAQVSAVSVSSTKILEAINYENVTMSTETSSEAIPLVSLLSFSVALLRRAKIICDANL